ncbi:MAG: hypothetical protein DWP95_09040 [Proteobacteria bacterium]|nr:MAG: hypothetical protein DWP95_09040 [Pseudomonadota bacterium]
MIKFFRVRQWSAQKVMVISAMMFSLAVVIGLYVKAAEWLGPTTLALLLFLGSGLVPAWWSWNQAQLCAIPVIRFIILGVILIAIGLLGTAVFTPLFGVFFCAIMIIPFGTAILWRTRLTRSRE